MGIDSHLSPCVDTQSPKYLEMAQGHISLSMALHNFIRDSSLADKEFDRCDEDEDYMPMSSSQPSTSQFGDEEGDMNAFRDNIANAIFANVN
jgi:hypothetical protein